MNKLPILRKNSSSFNRGFTIIELLVVIVIVGALVAITAVGYSGVNDKANDIAVQANLKQTGQKIEIAEAKKEAPVQYGDEATTLAWLNSNIQDSGDNYTPPNGYLAFFVATQPATQYNPEDPWKLAFPSKTGNVYIMDGNNGIQESLAEWKIEPSCGSNSPLGNSVYDIYILKASPRQWVTAYSEGVSSDC